MDPALSLYTRQQLAQLAGLDDATLNYWSREELLLPTKGGEGRGHHRRFDFIQVNIAAILGQIKRFGLNITVMRSFADLMQSGARIDSGRELHPSNYYYASRLATKINEFQSGKLIMIPKHNRAEEPPPNLPRKAYTEWLLEKRPASTEQEIIDEMLGDRNDYDSIENIVSVAKKIGPNRETEAEIYGHLVYDILAPGYSSEYSWLLGFGANESWRIEFGFEGGKFFDTLGSASAEEFGPGIFLPVSGIIRKIWGLKTPAEYMRERRAEHLRKQLAKDGIYAVVTPNGEGFNIDAPGVEWSLVEAVLSKLGYEAPSASAESAAGETG